jgi:hypothetical protein
MQANMNPAKVEGSAPALPEAENPAPRVYDCIGCRYVDPHGLVCDVCIRKILNGQAEQRRRESPLLAACFEGYGCVTLLRSRHAALV